MKIFIDIRPPESQHLAIITPYHIHISDKLDNVWWILNVINVEKLLG